MDRHGDRPREFLQHRIDRLERQAERHAARQKYRESIPLLEEACALSEEWFKEGAGATVQRLGQLALQYRRIGDRESAAVSYRRMATLQRETQRFDAQAYVCTLNSLGVLRCEMGKHRRALRPLRQALEVARGRPLEDASLLPMVASNLAGAHFCLDQYGISEALLGEALEALEALEGPKGGASAPSLDRLHCLCSLAEIRELQGDRPGALELARRAHGTVRKGAAAESPERSQELSRGWAEGLARIADFYRRIDQAQLALQLVQESARLLGDGSGTCDPELLRCVERLAKFGGQRSEGLALGDDDPGKDDR